VRRLRQSSPGSPISDRYNAQILQRPDSIAIKVKKTTRSKCYLPDISVDRVCPWAFSAIAVSHRIRVVHAWSVLLVLFSGLRAPEAQPIAPQPKAHQIAPNRSPNRSLLARHRGEFCLVDSVPRIAPRQKSRQICLVQRVGSDRGPHAFALRHATAPNCGAPTQRPPLASAPSAATSASSPAVALCFAIFLPRHSFAENFCRRTALVSVVFLIFFQN
jgi:hypothetical protein